MARRLEASVTLLHCYHPPPGFDFADGRRALKDLSLHRWKVRSRLYELTAEARKLFAKCSCRFVSGPPVILILRQSRRLLADLIAIPLPLDLVRWCWLPEELLDELIKKANCPVLCVPASQGFSKDSSPKLRIPARANKADPLTTDVEPTDRALVNLYP